MQCEQSLAVPATNQDILTLVDKLVYHDEIVLHVVAGSIRGFIVDLNITLAH